MGEKPKLIAKDACLHPGIHAHTILFHQYVRQNCKTEILRHAMAFYCF